MKDRKRAGAEREAGGSGNGPLDGPGGEESAAGGAEVGESGADALSDRLSAEIEGELAELEELRDRHLRLAAEFENYRKRTGRELAELRAQAQADLVRRILDTLDDLSRMAATPPEQASAESLVQGVDLIHRRLRKSLEEAGLARIEALGRPFDPTLHEGVAIAEVDDPERDETVAEVLAEGYRFRDRLVRPARVAVARYAGAAAGRDDAGGGGGA